MHVGDLPDLELRFPISFTD